MKLGYKYIYLPLLVLACTLAAGCFTVKYSFTGASIPPDAKTVSIAYFPNNAPTVAPTLSATLTDGLKDKFARQTKLQQVSDGAGDLNFQGEIIGYAVTPDAVSSGDDMASRYRLTITVRVTYINILDPQWNFTNKTFTAFSSFPSTQDLATAEGTLIPEIVNTLVDEIFNASVANW